MLHIAIVGGCPGKSFIHVTLFCDNRLRILMHIAIVGLHLAGWLCMRIAIPTWCGRVSPVFDVAQSLLLVDLGGEDRGDEREVALVATEPGDRVSCLVQLGVEVLVCGGISVLLENMLVSAGVEVIPQICGSTEAVLDAFARGAMSEEEFSMPGCRRRRRFRGGRGGGKRNSGEREEMA